MHRAQFYLVPLLLVNKKLSRNSPMSGFISLFFPFQDGPISRDKQITEDFSRRQWHQWAWLGHFSSSSSPFFSFHILLCHIFSRFPSLSLSFFLTSRIVRWTKEVHETTNKNKSHTPLSHPCGHSNFRRKCPPFSQETFCPFHLFSLNILHALFRPREKHAPSFSASERNRKSQIPLTLIMSAWNLHD